MAKALAPDDPTAHLSAHPDDATSGTAPPLASIICLDKTDRVVFTLGRGDEPALRALAEDPDWLAEVRRTRMAALKLNGQKLVILWQPLQSGALLLIHEDTGDTVFDFVASVDFAYDIFEHLLSNPYDGMTVVDKDAILRFISPVHEAFFNHRPGEATGKPVQKAIENTRLHKILKTGKPEVGHTQKMQGANRIVSRTPIFRNGHLLGAIGRVMFKGPEQLQEMSARIKSLQNEVEFYRREAEAMRRQDNGIDTMIGESRKMRDLKNDIVRIASLDVPVMLTGESGAGKELVAQALHRLSSRRVNSMVIVNAAALPATLVESELFGYSSGAFTGANQNGYSGKFEQANKGTLFLDEIGDMPMEVQAKLLRVLQDGLIEKLGSAKSVEVDFRLITATNRDLEEMVEQNSFRLDLYYRISPVVLRVPPLRERLEDIPALAEHFLGAFAARHGRAPCTLHDEALAVLQAQQWPGNVRQLKHEIERAAIFDTDGVIRNDDLSHARSGPEGSLGDLALPSGQGDPAGGDAGLEPSDATSMPLKDRLGRLEDQLIAETYKRLGGNKKKVAEELGISRSYLYKKLDEINPGD